MHVKMDRYHLLRWILTIIMIAHASACGYPGSPAHAAVSFSTEVIGPGTVASYTCDNGFELLGPTRRICGDNGTWIPLGIPFCVLNIAAGKAPMQSSVAGKGIPQKAIDGSTSTFFNAETCTMTESERAPWWYVNLLEPYMVQLVRIDFGTSCCSNNRPTTIVVRVGNNRPDLGVNPICNRYMGFIEEGRPLFLPCTTAMPGAFVSIHMEGPPGNPMSICETFVYTDQALPIERCPTFRDQPLGSTATYNGKCYIFYNNQPLNFVNSRRFCEIRGGSLIDETNPALQGFLSWELYRRHRNDPSGQYWMGAVRDPRDPNNWKWISGKDVTISFWNLPGTNENCSRFDGAKGWLWSDTNCNLNLNFICQHRPATCGKPERPANSTIIARSFEIGSVIEYRCSAGHLLVGPNIRSCLANGFFGEFPPKCRYLECGHPARIGSGGYNLLNGTRHYLSNVQYFCNEGHVLVGRGNLVCDVDEKWNGPPPRCDPIFCRSPPPISQGKFVLNGNSTVYGSVAKYFCASGFQMVGSDTLTCISTGYWDSEAPVCEREEVPPPVPTNPPTSTTVRRRPTSAPPPPSPPPPPPQVVPSAPVFTPQNRPSQIHQQFPSKDQQPSLTKLRISPSRTEPVTFYNPTVTTKSINRFTATPDPTPTTSTSSTLAPPMPSTNAPYHPGLLDNDTPILEGAPSNKIPVVEKPPQIPSRPSTKPSPSRVNTELLYPSRQPSVAPTRPTAPSPTPTLPSRPYQEIPKIRDEENEISDFSSKIRHREDSSAVAAHAKLNMGGIIALGAFGGFILIAITVTLILIFVRRTRNKRNCRRSLDNTTITTYDSSSSGERGFHKYYRRAWENLRYDGKSNAFPIGHHGEKAMNGHAQMSRQETLDHPAIRGNGTIEGFREASEITVNDVAALYSRPEKKDRNPPRSPPRSACDHSPTRDKRAIREWYSQQLGNHSRRAPY